MRLGILEHPIDDRFSGSNRRISHHGVKLALDSCKPIGQDSLCLHMILGDILRRQSQRALR